MTRSSRLALNAFIMAGAAAAGIILSRAVSRKTRSSLRNHVVLITGGSRGLGLLLAREFAREGCRLSRSARNPDELEVARNHLKHRACRNHFSLAPS